MYFTANRFAMAWENGIQVPFPFFVVAWHWKTDLNFAFCFSFSPNFEKPIWTGYEFRFSFSHYFEKRIWISFFVFVWLVIEKQIWISFVVSAWLEKRISAPVQSFEVPGHTLGVDRGIHLLCNWKQKRAKTCKNEIHFRFSKWCVNKKRKMKFVSVF